MLIFGTLPKVCCAEGMTSYLYDKHVRIFDYPRFAEPFRDQLRENAGRLAAANGQFVFDEMESNLLNEFKPSGSLETFATNNFVRARWAAGNAPTAMLSPNSAARRPGPCPNPDRIPGRT